MKPQTLALIQLLAKAPSTQCDVIITKRVASLGDTITARDAKDILDECAYGGQVRCLHEFANKCKD